MTPEAAQNLSDWEEMLAGAEEDLKAAKMRVTATAQEHEKAREALLDAVVSQFRIKSKIDSLRLEAARD